MKSRHLLPTGVLVAGMFVLARPPVSRRSSGRKEFRAMRGEWNVQALRPAGQPVIPVFDGWILEEDGTANLCLGYINLNFDEALEIPLGPNNYIEPARYNGIQPTYFNPVPMNAGNKQRHYCLFTVNVPVGDTERIVWHLGRDYQDYSFPPTRDRSITVWMTSSSPRIEQIGEDPWHPSSGSSSRRGRRE